MKRTMLVVLALLAFTSSAQAASAPGVRSDSCQSHIIGDVNKLIIAGDRSQVRDQLEAEGVTPTDAKRRAAEAWEVFDLVKRHLQLAAANAQQQAQQQRTQPKPQAPPPAPKPDETPKP